MTVGRRSAWVFAYGSLVSLSSLARTLGREPRHGVTFHAADLAGAVRRWNAAMDNHHEDETDKHYRDAGGLRPDVGVAFLGLSDAGGAESVNGAVVRVDAAMLAAFDRRERRYLRRRVTHRIAAEGAGRIDGDVYAYYPTPRAIRTAARHAAAGTLVASQEYAEVVERGFAELGDEHLATYRSTTPPPPAPSDLRVVRPTD